jgi:hypothetical protein
METLALEKQDWQKMLDFVSKAQEVQRKAQIVTVEVDGEQIGAQREAEDVALMGISYGPKDDMVYIIAEGIEHNIENPAKVEIAHDGADISTLAVVGEDGARHLVRFKPPLHLPGLA